MTRRETILDAVSAAHRTHWKPTDDQETGNLQSKAVERDWQRSVARSVTEVKSEMPVKGTHLAIDIVDLKEGVAYEIKSSGKNPGHEFFKDVFKALAYNRSDPETPVQRLVFLTEEGGAHTLVNGLGKIACDLALEFGLAVEIKVVP